MIFKYSIQLFILFRSMTMETNEDDDSRRVPDNSIDDGIEISEEDKQFQECLEKLLMILKGEMTIDLHRQFLIENNHADLLILKQIRVNET